MVTLQRDALTLVLFTELPQRQNDRDHHDTDRVNCHQQPVSRPYPDLLVEPVQVEADDKPEEEEANPDEVGLQGLVQGGDASPVVAEEGPGSRKLIPKY